MPKRGCQMIERHKVKFRQSVIKRLSERKEDIVTIKATIKLSQREYDKLSGAAAFHGHMRIEDEISYAVKGYINKMLIG